MPQFISLEISAEEVADLMAEDSEFAWEIWVMLAERLNMGAMADDLLDLVGSCRNKSHAKWVLDQYQESMARIAGIHLQDDTE